MMNPLKIMKLKGSWEKFVQNHPKFPLFLNAVRDNGIDEGSVIEINITTPSGKVISTNIKVLQSDKEILSEIKELIKD